MTEPNWLEMLACRQTLHQVSRKLLQQSRSATLNQSELELLSLLYLNPEENTPLALSTQSGTKKEAISRTIRSLTEKGCLQKTPNPLDERSYSLGLTQNGLQKLSENYEAILKPFYQLSRSMGGEFKPMFDLLSLADRLLADPEQAESSLEEKI